MLKKLPIIVLAALLSGIAAKSYAHYPWLATNSEGKAILFFGETPADRTYKLPASIKAAKVMAGDKEVEVEAVESDDLIGLVSKESVGESSLNSQVTFGIYHGTKLDYYVQHQAGALPKAKPEANDKSKLHASVVDADEGVNVFVVFDGKPISNAEVKLYCAEGHEEAKATTDKDGKVFFTDKEVEEGLNGLLIGVTVEEGGELDGKAYKTESHYLTTTFQGE